LLVNIVYLLDKVSNTPYFIVMVYCVAFGCNNNSCSSKNISFFRFPADAAQRHEWTRRIRGVAPYTRLCSVAYPGFYNGGL